MVDLASGERVTYDFRGVDQDLRIDWDAIESPADTLGPKKSVGSNYRQGPVAPSAPHEFARGLDCRAQSATDE
jgi:hypothetical protein